MYLRLALLLLLASASAWPQSKPDFSGVWTLNKAESDYSDPRAAVPDRLVRTVKQKGENLKYKVQRERGGQKGEFEVDLDIGGSPYESDAAGVVSAEWNGTTLVLKTLYNPGSDRQSDQEENWSLSADGKKLTDQLTVHPPRGGKEVHVKRVFDKQN